MSSYFGQCIRTQTASIGGLFWCYSNLRIVIVLSKQHVSKMEAWCGFNDYFFFFFFFFFSPFFPCFQLMKFLLLTLKRLAFLFGNQKTVSHVAHAAWKDVQKSPPNCLIHGHQETRVHWSYLNFQGKGLVGARKGIGTPSAPYMR